MNTFSWVICKCQSGNRAERGGWGERERSQKKTVATTGCFVLPESRNQKALARSWAGAGGERREGRDGGGRGWDTEEGGDKSGGIKGGGRWGRESCGRRRN